VEKQASEEATVSLKTMTKVMAAIAYLLVGCAAALFAPWGLAALVFQSATRPTSALAVQAEVNPRLFHGVVLFAREVWRAILARVPTLPRHLGMFRALLTTREFLIRTA